MPSRTIFGKFAVGGENIGSNGRLTVSRAATGEYAVVDLLQFGERAAAMFFNGDAYLRGVRFSFCFLCGDSKVCGDMRILFALLVVLLTISARLLLTSASNSLGCLFADVDDDGIDSSSRSSFRFWLFWREIWDVLDAELRAVEVGVVLDLLFIVVSNLLKKDIEREREKNRIFGVNGFEF